MLITWMRRITITLTGDLHSGRLAALSPIMLRNSLLTEGNKINIFLSCECDHSPKSCFSSIAPFWLSREHRWILITPFWLATDDKRIIARSHLHVKPSRNSHERYCSRNGMEHGYLVAVTGSTWQLRGLHGCYVTNLFSTDWNVVILWQLRGNYRICVAVTGCT